MTGDGLAQIIMAQLKGYQLDLRYFVGQGYDGASAMSGLFHGVQAILRKECPTALYVHCASHLLNLTLSTACKKPQIRNANGIVEVATFFNRSGKRLDLQWQCIKDHEPHIKKKQLVQLRETRWVERHDAIISFLKLFGSVILA